ncbi:MAG TPA: hypothetical protein VKZ18_29565 [Polyangia bacterium]|nr:hypothetical protein [Polyangia bacterium]
MVAGGLGCSSRSLTPTDPTRPSDASTRPSDAARPSDASKKPIDAATRPVDASMGRLDASTRPFDAGIDASLDCGCQVGADGVMHMSWSCLQTYYGGATNVLRWCGSPGSLVATCGLVVYSYRDNNGLLEEFVYDESSGLQVGGHYETNIQYYAWACPDQDISALKVEGGTFPASSCTTSTPCGCGADGRSIACPPPADAGTSSWDAAACDCRIGADGVLRMSWDCFCAAYGCGNPEQGWCGGPGQWTTGCGLDVYTWDRFGETQIYVYDKSGTQVGTQMQTGGAGFFECPTDPTLQSATVAGGMFPAASCATSVCPCDPVPGGGVGHTFTCPGSDGGSSDAAQDHSIAH